MTDPMGGEPAIKRRHLFRRGAVLAGAAGATAVAASLGPTTADAADGDPVLLGETNEARTTTTVVADGPDVAVLTLTNPEGPALALTPVASSWSGRLAVGEIAATESGPVVGADWGSGAESVFLATTRDLEDLPTTYSVRPIRVLDTRWTTPPESIVASTVSALDPKGRLRGEGWLDIAVAPADEGMIYHSIYANVGVVDPTGNGWLTIYPSGLRPNTSTINFQTDRSVSNGLFTSVAVVGDSYCVRIWVSRTTHVLLDITGVIVTAENTRTPSEAARRESAERTARHVARAARIGETLAGRSR